MAKNDTVFDSIYDRHLNGRGFRNNPQQNRLAVLEQMYIRILTELSINRYKWIGLPDTVDERFLELTLFHRGLCVFYYDTDRVNAKGKVVERGFDRYLALQAYGMGRINMYDNPTTFTVGGTTLGFSRRVLRGSECVPIWANRTRVPDTDIVLIYATKLAQADRTIEINMENARNTKFIAVEESQRHSAVQVLRQMREGQSTVFGTMAMSQLLENLQAIDLAPDKEMVLNVQVAKAKIWNEAMTLLGINNANQDKRERLVADEVAANNDQVANTRNVGLKSRMEAVEQINKMYGLKVRVGWDPSVDFLVRDYTATIVGGVR